MLYPVRLFILLAFGVSACVNTEQAPPARPEAYAVASSQFAVLAQKAVTYQADFQLEAWAQLLAGNVEYHLPVGDSLVLLRGKTAVVSHWSAWKKYRQVQGIHLSRFSIIPLHCAQELPLADLPGVYVPVLFRQRITYVSGREVERPGCLWLHFNEQKLIDRLYDFQPMM